MQYVSTVQTVSTTGGGGGEVPEDLPGVVYTPFDEKIRATFPQPDQAGNPVRGKIEALDAQGEMVLQTGWLPNSSPGNGLWTDPNDYQLNMEFTGLDPNTEYNLRTTYEDDL